MGECSCPDDTCNDPPCPTHGFPKCAACGEDVHDFISCETLANIRKRGQRETMNDDDTTEARPCVGVELGICDELVPRGESCDPDVPVCESCYGSGPRGPE